MEPPLCYFTAARRDRKEAFKTSKTIREVVREQTDLSEEELDEVLDAKKMVGT